MMNDGMLSQDEIDALLKSTDEEINEDDHGETPPVEEYLSSLEQDALGEIGNISFGSSATTLSTLLNQKVDITTPQTTVIKRSKLIDEFPQPHVGVEVKYTQGFSGMNIFVIKSEDAAIIADLMLGGDGNPTSNELSDISLSAVQEAMNQMMGTAATSMSTIFNKRVDISPPSINVLDVEEATSGEDLSDDDVLIKVSFQLKIGNLIDSNIMQLLPVSFAKDLVYELLNPEGDDDSKTEEHVSVSTQASSQVRKQTKEVQSYSEQESKREPSPKHLGEAMYPNAAIQQAEFSNFDNSDLPSKEKRNLDMLLDIPLKVTVELGRTKRTVKDVLELSSGSIIELDKLAGEPVNIHVNDKLIAKGEVVVIDENFGVRVTDIISQSDRIKRLK
ncbi:flagellar motor switch phosphatase FliY [Aquibacillus halophilus]|uniref:Flagellar motor switch phosphatase FliY n=1 Tax=Aquibacillus halophilus TaxID=930132 RepID=A0A6A8DEJ2_9BACI|nr:flagellar motor switch phosphatase FliY [Aquibacillus halophilus]MRH42269.1 flagellar motor switch phosphatase FliY [Aquibacillus halophilus]